MLQFWAVIGRFCLDRDFHHELFERANPDLPFEELGELIRFLRIDQGLSLGRWQIMELDRIVSGNYSGTNFISHASADDDHEVAAIRHNLDDLEPLPFPENEAFCAAFGLCCVDRLFRRDVYRCESGAALQEELAQSTLIHPGFDLSADEAERLWFLVKTKEQPISVFHQANWIIPGLVACCAGYSPDAGYLHTSQPGAISFLLKRPDALDNLLRSRIAQGSAKTLRPVLLPA